MTKYLYRVVDRDGEHYGVSGPNYDPQMYWDEDDMEPYGIVVPERDELRAADKEHPSGAPHRWQRTVTAWEEVK